MEINATSNLSEPIEISNGTVFLDHQRRFSFEAEENSVVLISLQYDTGKSQKFKVFSFLPWPFIISVGMDTSELYFYPEIKNAFSFSNSPNKWFYATTFSRDALRPSCWAKFWRVFLMSICLFCLLVGYLLFC